MLKHFTLIFFIILSFQQSLLSEDINIDLAVKNSQTTKKPVVLYFHRIGCSYCNSMQEFTLEDDAVIEFMKKNFNLISINVSVKDTITYKGKVSGGLCLAKNIGYSFYPSTIFLDDNADIKYAVPGYKSESEFLVILEYIQEGHYKTMSLDEYKENVGYEKNLEDEINDERKHAR